MRWKRRRLRYRAFRKRHEISPVRDRTNQISKTDVIAFSTMRNEMLRLPYFLDHHRRLGIRHFLIVDNQSDDGTAAYLAEQPDVSLWTSAHSYKASRFGVDWLTWLMLKYGHGRWCLTVDADELLIYPHWPDRPLDQLTAWLDQNGIQAFGALMLDIYPKGPTDQARYKAGQNPTEVLSWFDADGYTSTRQKPLMNLWQQGGARARVFFADTPRLAPTLNKLPLVKWNRRFVYVNSTHSMMPPRMNLAYDGVGGSTLSGVLLHTKFLYSIADRSAEEQVRKEHFYDSSLYDPYYDRLKESPDLWCPDSVRYEGWEQLVRLGLMSAGDWPDQI